MTPNKPLAISARRETAASHMVTQIPRATAATPVATVIESLRGKMYECADTVFVTDDNGQLEGLVRINDLFADAGGLIGEVMKPEHEAVRLEDDQEQIAMRAMELDMIAVPVVDDDNKLIGAVPPEALFRILRAEHMEDLQRLAGIGKHEQGPDIALTAPLFEQFRRRLPWLIFGLFASSLITVVMANFEKSLLTNISVAFFIPAVVYIAGAIGTQAVSVAVRGLSVGDVSITRLLGGELVIGTAIAASLGMISSIMVLLAFGDTMLSLVVGLAVLTGGTVSGLVGFGMPWTFKRFGADPALGSGPVCTIIQDVTNLSIYLVLASALIV